MNDPAAMRRQLRVELKHLRAKAELTQRQVAVALDWSPSKIIRIENGSVGISVTDLKALAAEYGMTDGNTLDKLAEMARGSKKQPFVDYRDVLSTETIRYLGYEASASLIRQVQLLLVPGLLQTEEYTRALLEGYGMDAKRADRLVESRRDRQELLDTAEPPMLFVIIDEAVLRRAIGGAPAMRRQLRHLLEMDSRPSVTIQVLPFSLGAYEALQGPFVHLEFRTPSDPDVLFLENMRGSSSFIDDPEVTGPYQEAFFKLEDTASTPGQLAEYIARADRGLDAGLI